MPGSLYIKKTGRDGTELLQILIVSILVDQGSDAAGSHESSAGYEKVSSARAGLLSLEAGRDGCDCHEQGKDGSGRSCSDCKRFSASHFGC